MGEKSHYNYRVEPQDVDFTLRATIPSLGSAILNTAGIDAHGKGFGVDALNADNHPWVLSRMAVEFDCQPGQYTDYTIATWINEYGRVLSTRNFTLTDAAGNEFGRAVTQWAMIDLRSRSALDLSWVGDAHADAIVDAPSPTDKPRKIRDVDPAQTAVHKVVYSDIDFNRHVNTMRYIEMMLDVLPIERFAEERPLRLDINFLKEARYGQTLSVALDALYRNDDRHAAPGNADAGGARAVGHPFPARMPLRADACRRLRTTRPYGAVRDTQRCRYGGRTCLYRVEIGLRGMSCRHSVERVLQVGLQNLFSLWKPQSKHRTSIR